MCMNAMRECVSVDSLTLFLCACVCVYLHIDMRARARAMPPVFIQNKTTVLIHYGYAGIHVRVHAHARIYMHTFCKLTGSVTILFLSVLINISRRWLRKGH